MTPVKAPEAQKKDSAKTDNADMAPAEKKEKAKQVDFVRKDTRPGIYSTKLNGRDLKIRDRQHYFTADPHEIEFLERDPEIVIFDPGTKNKK